MLFFLLVVVAALLLAFVELAFAFSVFFCLDWVSVKWRHFSLRELLVATTVVAISMAITVAFIKGLLHVEY